MGIANHFIADNEQRKNVFDILEFKALSVIDNSTEHFRITGIMITCMSNSTEGNQDNRAIRD